MPVCTFFLRGICTNDKCPYLHVSVDPKAEVCPDFLKGYCAKGSHCKLKHVDEDPKKPKQKTKAKRKRQEQEEQEDGFLSLGFVSDSEDGIPDSLNSPLHSDSSPLIPRRLDSGHVEGESESESESESDEVVSEGSDDESGESEGVEED